MGVDDGAADTEGVAARDIEQARCGCVPFCQVAVAAFDEDFRERVVVENQISAVERRDRRVGLSDRCKGYVAFDNRGREIRGQYHLKQFRCAAGIRYDDTDFDVTISRGDRDHAAAGRNSGKRYKADCAGGDICGDGRKNVSCKCLVLR